MEELWSELSFSLPDITLRAKVWGENNAKEKIFAVHGFLDNAGSFDFVAPLLLKNRKDLQLVCLDLPGHGQSDHLPFLAEYFITTYVTVIERVLALLGWEEYHLMGHSLGGNALFTFAATFPNKIKSLIIFDIMGSSSAVEEELPDMLRKAIDGKNRSTLRQRRVYSTIDEVVSRYKSVNQHISLESVHRLVLRGTKKIDTGYIFSHDVRLVADIPPILKLTENQVRAFLKKVKCPTLIVWADKDKRSYTYDDDLAMERFKCLEKANLVRLEGGGHHLHLDHPDRVVLFILRFWGDLGF